MNRLDSCFNSLCGLAVLALFISPLRADSFGYAIDSTQFGVLDVTTGAFSVTSSIPNEMAGLDIAPGGNVYVYDLGNNDELHEVNPITGAETLIGSGVELDMAGDLTNGTFYGFDSNGNEDLYSINLTTGATTLIGNTNVGCGTNSGQIAGTASTLYLFCLNGNMYSINPQTAAASLIGNTGESITGAGYLNGTMYAFHTSDEWSVNLATAAATLVTTVNSSSGIYGVVAETATPEPGTMVLLAAGIGGMLAAGRVRRQRQAQV